MRRFLFCSAFLGCSVAFAGELTLSVQMSGMSGRANLVNKVMSDGSKYVRMSMVLKDPTGKSVTVLQESTYDKTGAPVRKLQTVTSAGGSSRQAIVVTFDAGGAYVKIEQGGKTVNQHAPVPAGKRIAATPEFWFVRDHPKPGDVVTYWRFDLNTLGWVESKSQYHGYRTISVGGKQTRAHLVTLGNVSAYVDESGDPYKIESDGTTLVRA